MVNSTAPSKFNQGQGLVEYALLLAMVAVVVTASLSVAGPAVGNIFSNIVDQLSGAVINLPLVAEAPAAGEAPSGPTFAQLSAAVTSCVTNDGARNSLSNAADHENLSTFKTLLTAHQDKISPACHSTLTTMANSMG